MKCSRFLFCRASYPKTGSHFSVKRSCGAGMNSDYNVIKFRKPVKASKPRPKRWPVTTLVFLIFAALCIGFDTFSPWDVPTTFGHYIAAAGCDAAKAVGLAPAKKGEAGYWRHLDARHDGVTCEGAR